jgi:hypothetical protein
MKSDLDAIRIEDLRKNKKEREDDLIPIRDKTCIFNSNLMVLPPPHSAPRNRLGGIFGGESGQLIHLVGKSTASSPRVYPKVAAAIYRDTS